LSLPPLEKDFSAANTAEPVSRKTPTFDTAWFAGTHTARILVSALRQRLFSTF
jgi:hypothetical protein